MCLAFIEMKPCFLDHLTKQSNFLFRYSISVLIILYMFWAFGCFDKRSEISSGKQYLLLSYQIYRSVWFNYIEDTCMQKWENVLLHFAPNIPPLPPLFIFSFSLWRSFVFQTEKLANLFKLINFLAWDPASPYSTVCRCGPVDISYFGRLSTDHKKNAFFSSLKQTCRYSWWAALHEIKE